MDFCDDLDFSAVCRTCLGTKDLNPLFKKTAYPKTFSKTMLQVTGLKVGINDGLPQNICKVCLKQIRTAVAFQINCRRADQKLKLQNQYINFIAMKYQNLNSNKETDNDIETADDSEVIIKTETHEEEILELDTQVLNLLPMVGMLNEEEIDEGIKDRLISSANEFKKKDDIVDLGESHDDESASENDKQINCKFCQQQFLCQDMLVKHMSTCKSVMEESEKKVPSAVWGKETVECTICSKKLQRASLKIHTKIKHSGLGPICDHCGKKFSNKFRLKEHMRSKHGFAKFKCSQCKFESATTIGLANHERRHRGEKPFVCEVCGARFHAAYLLTQHKQSHRTERLLKCDLCPASFKSNNGLHTHRAACHGPTRHACPECGRAYSCRHYLVRHMRTVHRYEGAVPFQPVSWTGNKSDRQHMLPTAGNSLLADQGAVPVQPVSWTDNKSGKQHMLPTAGNSVLALHMRAEPDT